MAGPLRIFVSADVATHEQMRFVLMEIVRRADAEPFGFDIRDAADIARQVLESVSEVERRERSPHA